VKVGDRLKVAVDASTSTIRAALDHVRKKKTRQAHRGLAVHGAPMAQLLIDLAYARRHLLPSPALCTRMSTARPAPTGGIVNLLRALDHQVRCYEATVSPFG